MAEERKQPEDVSDATRKIREEEREAREREPEERRPEERGPANTAGEASDVQG